MTRKALALFISLFLCSFAQAKEIQYTNSSAARLSHTEGNVYVQRAADLSYEEGVINMPIAEGDRLGTTDGRMELYIARGKYIRLDHNAKIDILELPDRNKNQIRIRLWAGNCYLRVNDLKDNNKIEVHSQDVTIYILDRGLYRVDVRENQETEIFVFKGLLEAALEKGSELIREQQRLEVIDGFPTSRPTGFSSTTEDSFDRWNIQRDQTQRRYLPSRTNSNERRILKNRVYPSSPSIQSAKRRTGRRTQYSSSPLGRLYNSISGGKSSYIRGSSRSSYIGTSTRRISSGSRQGSTRPLSMRAPSSRTKKK